MQDGESLPPGDPIGRKKNGSNSRSRDGDEKPGLEDGWRRGITPDADQHAKGEPQGGQTPHQSAQIAVEDPKDKG